MDIETLPTYISRQKITKAEMTILGEIISEMETIHEEFITVLNETKELDNHQDTVLQMLMEYKYWVDDIVISSFYKLR